ncbi:uncharacterized protein LOC5515843 [Nematostella vectensis]|uniref:uncharacterized protein LOC5515843 n=1 Tax=Nematostella vectensis TaxID=45351 RepID=UPI002076EDA9|nr:uncharacterized protein LOC5515843 [Nematostella vectensis]
MQCLETGSRPLLVDHKQSAVKGEIKIRKLCEDRRRKWLANIARKDLDDKKAENTRVCSNHFISGKPADIMDTTNPDWAPTVNLGHSNVGDVSMAVNRNARAKSRQKKREEIIEQGRVDMANTSQEIEITSHDFEDPTSSIKSTPEEFELNKSAQTEHTPTRDQACQTDIGMSQLEEEKNLPSKCP